MFWLIPEIIPACRNYSREKFFHDLSSGITVGIVAIPLALAFGIASGVKPEQGLYTAIVAGFVISLFGGSKVQISGPTGAFIPIVLGIVKEFGYEGLASATVLAGAFLILLGLCRAGSLLRLIPASLITGFTTGIAVIIFSTQVKEFLGLQISEVPSEFLEKWGAYATHLSTLSSVTVAVSVITLIVLLGMPKLSRKIPASLAALVVATTVAVFFELSVTSIGSKFGQIPHTLPSPQLPLLTFSSLSTLFFPAIAITLLGGIESLLSAQVSDRMIRARSNPNMELIAQGIGNIVSPIFLGIPATGAIARTATNVKNGGKTPVSGLIHAATILLVMTTLGTLVAYIPMAALAAILVIVSYNMSDWRTFVKVLKGPGLEKVTLLGTFLGTVITDLTFGIMLGMLLYWGGRACKFQHAPYEEPHLH